METILAVMFIIIGIFAFMGLVRIFFCGKSSVFDSPGATGNTEFLKNQQKQLKEFVEKDSRNRAIEQEQYFLKNNTDKYKFIVTTKDGTTYESEEFSAKTNIKKDYYSSDYSNYHCYTYTAKEITENAKDGLNYQGHYPNIYNMNFLKVGDIEVNVNEILTKQVVKI